MHGQQNIKISDAKYFGEVSYTDKQFVNCTTYDY